MRRRDAVVAIEVVYGIAVAEHVPEELYHVLLVGWSTQAVGVQQLHVVARTVARHSLKHNNQHLNGKKVQEMVRACQ